MNKATISYNKMWHRVETELVEYSEGNWGEELPELSLLAAVVISAARDRDYNYFSSVEYKRHAELLKCDPKFVLSVLKQVIAFEDSGEEWVDPKSLEETPKDDDWDF